MRTYNFHKIGRLSKAFVQFASRSSSPRTYCECPNHVNTWQGLSWKKSPRQVEQGDSYIINSSLTK